MKILSFAIRGARSAVGPELAVMVDYNQSLTPTEARARLQVLDGSRYPPWAMADIDGVVASGVEFDEDAVRKYLA